MLKLLFQALKEFPNWLLNEWPYIIIEAIKDKAAEIENKATKIEARQNNKE